MEFGSALVLFINKEFTILRFCCVWDGVRVYPTELSFSHPPGSTDQKHGRVVDNGFRLRGVWAAGKAFLRSLGFGFKFLDRIWHLAFRFEVAFQQSTRPIGMSVD